MVSHQCRRSSTSAPGAVHDTVIRAGPPLVCVGRSLRVTHQPGAHVHGTIRTHKRTHWRQAIYVKVSCTDAADREAVWARAGVELVGVGLAGCDGLGRVGWVGWPCAGCCGRGPGLRGAAAEAPCGRGDGSPPGRAVRAGWLLRGLAVALNGGSVLPQATSPQPPVPGRTEWPARVIITTPASTATAAPAPATAYRGCRASAARHRPRLAAWWRPALPMSRPLRPGSRHHRMPAEDVRMHPHPCDQGWQRQCSNGEADQSPKPANAAGPAARRRGTTRSSVAR